MSGSQPMPVSPYAPPVRRPPLPSSMARSARLAGGVGFALLSAGWGLFSIAALVGVLWAFLSGLFALIASRDPSFASQMEQLRARLDSLPIALIIGVLIVVAVVGVLLWLTGLFVSRGILARAGHPRPWAVTWAGLGLGVVASWVITGIAQVLSNLIGAFWQLPQGDASTDFGAVMTGVAVQAGVWLLVVGVLHVVAGVLLWWAMAVAMRPAAPAQAVAV